MEKIRKTDKKGHLSGNGSLTPKHSQNKIHIESHKSSPYDPKKDQKGSLLEVLKQKFGLENSNENSRTNNTSSSEKKSDKDNLVGSWKDFGAKGSSNMVAEGGARDTHKGSNSWNESKVLKPANQEMIVESDNSEPGQLPHHSHELKSGPDQSRVSRYSIGTNEKPATEKNNQEPTNASPRYRLSYSTESKRNREKSPANNEQDTTKRNEAEHTSQKKHSPSDLDIEEGNDEEQNSGSKYPLPVEGSTRYLLHQWIDQKLIGFAVFQNAAREEHDDLTEEELVKLTGRQWNQLSKSVQDEYTSFARKARPGLKDELNSFDTTDLNDLKDLADARIKKIMKQN